MDRSDTINKILLYSRRATFILLAVEAIYAIGFVTLNFMILPEFTISDYFRRRFDSWVVLFGVYPMSLSPIALFYSCYFYIVYIALSIYNIYIIPKKIKKAIKDRKFIYIVTIIFNIMYVALRIIQTDVNYRWIGMM